MKKNIVKIIYKDVPLKRNFMIVQLPKNMNLNDIEETYTTLEILGGINLANNFTTVIGFEKDNCIITKPNMQEYLQLMLMMKSNKNKINK